MNLSRVVRKHYTMCGRFVQDWGLKWSGTDNLGGRIPPVMDARRTRRPMNALQKLIFDYLADNPDENYSTIARRAGMSRSTVYSLATKQERRQTPHPDTIKALARGMGMPESVVRAAAGDAAGYHGANNEIQSGRGRLVVEAASLLDDERLEALARRARYLLAEMREEQGDESGH